MALEYSFTFSHKLEVYDKDYTTSNPRPDVCLVRPGLSGSQEDNDAYQAAYATLRDWEQKGGKLTLYCPAIIERVYKADKQDFFFRDVFLDLSHVHGGVYDQPMEHFTTERYQREDGAPHQVVVPWEGVMSSINITRHWQACTTAQKAATIKHTMAIGEAFNAPHCNQHARVIEMVHNVRQIVGANLASGGY